MLSAAKSITRANRKSWCVLKTHCTNKLGSQQWFINLAIFPVDPASMQNSGALSEPWSSYLSNRFTANGTFCDRLCQNKHHQIDKEKHIGIKNREEIS